MILRFQQTRLKHYIICWDRLNSCYPEEFSKITLAGRRGDGNLIEQNDIFVQLREGRAREEGWQLFWQSERLPRLGALPSFYACHTRTVSISWENSPFLIARDIGRFPLRYMIPIYKTVENHAILQCIIYLILLQAKTIAKTRQIHHSLHRHIL